MMMTKRMVPAADAASTLAPMTNRKKKAIRRVRRAPARTKGDCHAGSFLWLQPKSSPHVCLSPPIPALVCTVELRRELPPSHWEVDWMNGVDTRTGGIAGYQDCLVLSGAAFVMTCRASNVWMRCIRHEWALVEEWIGVDLG